MTPLPGHRARTRPIRPIRDPGVPNWIDTVELPTGMVFWCFLLPEEQLLIHAEIVDIASLS